MDYRTFLRHLLAERQAKNPGYSLRAFARHLHIGSTTLSGVIARKRHMSKKNIETVADSLGLAPNAKIEMLRSAGFLPAAASSPPFISINEEDFSLISNWYFFAILNLAKIPTAKNDPTWIAEQLGISQAQAVDALELLLRRGYLANVTGRLLRTAAPIVTVTDVPSSALRSHHTQILEKAHNALRDIPVVERDVTAITMAISKSKIPKAKKLISEFQDKMESLLESEEPDDVYSLAIQLFPLTNRPNIEVFQ
ncbi:MAG: DUF4423 domain-containing protein [Proteobacteria bacterium]|nr:DUF4423 domain-containing protein [Pseudomonadota bacterium]